MLPSVLGSAWFSERPVDPRRSLVGEPTRSPEETQMVQAAPELKHEPIQDEDTAYISPTRGGGHPGHVLGFFLAAQVAPMLAILLALSFVNGGSWYGGWMWLAVGLLAVPAALMWGAAVFLAEHGLEVD